MDPGSPALHTDSSRSELRENPIVEGKKRGRIGMCQVRVFRIKLKDWTVGSFPHCLQVWPGEQWNVLKLF